MKLIYEPEGKAREYSPLALNIYNGCSHQCSYCYLRRISKLLSANKPIARKNIVAELDKQLSKFCPKIQVLLSFVSDIFCDGANITSDVIDVLVKYQVPVAFLTKNKRATNYLEQFKKLNDKKVGYTLTFDNNSDSKKYEPGASTPQERIDALNFLHKNGVSTFVSIEPVVYAEQSLEMIKRTINFVDLYKIGKLNGVNPPKPIDWGNFGLAAIVLLQKYKKEFYIKKDLAEYIPNIREIVSPKNLKQDYYILKKTNCGKTQLSFF